MTTEQTEAIVFGVVIVGAMMLFAVLIGAATHTNDSRRDCTQACFAKCEDGPECIEQCRGACR